MARPAACRSKDRKNSARKRIVRPRLIRILVVDFTGPAVPPETGRLYQPAAWPWASDRVGCRSVGRGGLALRGGPGGRRPRTGPGGDVAAGGERLEIELAVGGVGEEHLGPGRWCARDPGHHDGERQERLQRREVAVPVAV